MTVSPDEPPMIEQILGTPESAIKWVVVVLLGKAGWNAIDRFLPVKHKGGVTQIIESGPGSVQER